MYYTTIEIELVTKITLVKRRQWIAIIERGGCTFMRKILLATKLGAVGAIIIDNDPLATEPILMRTLGI